MASREDGILAITFIVVVCFLLFVAKRYYDCYHCEERLQKHYPKLCNQFDQRVDEARQRVAYVPKDNVENGDGGNYEGIIPQSGSYSVVQKIQNEGYIRYNYHLTFHRDYISSSPHLYRISGSAACFKTTHVSHPVDKIQEGYLNAKTGKFWWLEETSLSQGSLTPVFGDYRWYQEKNTTVLVTGQWQQQQQPGSQIQGVFYGVELFPPHYADDSPQSELIEKCGSFSSFELIEDTTTTSSSQVQSSQ
jgi:hypothetical protein